MEKTINKKKNNIKTKENKKTGKYSIRFTMKNYLVFLGGLLTLFLGYFLLSKGSIVAAPVLLILGYIFIIPISIFVR